MNIKKIIKNDVYGVLKEYIDYEQIVIEQPKIKTMGDYSIPCFSFSKILHKSPIDIATFIKDNINKQNYEKIDVVNGYLNLTISDKLLNEKLIYMNNNVDFGIEKPKQKELFFLDYGGPNVAKPLHVGHMRTAIVGESIKRIIKFMGHDTICDVHLGDYGLQIGEVIYGMIKDNIQIDNLTIEYLDYIYPKMNSLCKEDDALKEECALITKKLQDNNPLYQKYFKKIREVSVSDIKKNYDYLSVHFDLWQGESDSYKYLKNVEDILIEKKLAQNSEGAIVVDIKEDSDKLELPPLLFKKSNGAYLYASTDLATIYERMKKYNPNHILYVVDNRQNLHFTQVFRTCEKMGICDMNKLEFLGYGTVNGSDNKPYKTRNGDTPKLENLFKQAKDIFISKKESNKDMSNEDIDKIVNAILKFADLENMRERDYIFDLNKFSDVIGKTGPYILYTYLRINKIISNSNIKEITNIIYNEVDRNLRFKITCLEEILINAFNERKPNYIAEYLYELCVLANIFYQNNHLSNLEDENKKNDWIYVLNLTNRIIKQLLNLLVIDIPTIM